MSLVVLLGLAPPLASALVRRLAASLHEAVVAERTEQVDEHLVDAVAVVADLRRRDAVGAIDAWRTRRPSLPILVLAGPEGQHLEALEKGATDYVLAPFTPEEVALRLETRLHPPRALARRLVLGERVIDLERAVVTGPEGETGLTPTELKLLRYLAERPGRILTRRELLHQVWGYAPGTRTHTLTTTMARLRAKVESEPADPQWLQAVYGVGYRFDPPRQAPSAPGVARAPSAHLFGRAALLEALCARVERGASFTTLVGPAGVGKTRLAREIIARRPESDVVFVDLAAATERQSVLERVAAALGIRLGADAVAQVAEVLRGRPPGVLVLDNAEHVAEAVAEIVGDWRHEGAVIVTSRVPLEVPREQVTDVRPLALDEGAELFVDRAAARGVSLSADDPAVRDLVRALDSLPLALELAAPRMSVLTPSALREHLDLDLLEEPAPDVPARRRSVRAALALSWQRLAPELRRAMGQLSVFAGGFDVDAALATLDATERHPLDVLQALVHEHLVVRVAPERFDLLALVRAFAQERVAPAARRQAEDRHLGFYARMGQESLEEHLLREWKTVHARLERDAPNLYAALDRALDRESWEPAAGCGLALLAHEERIGLSEATAARVDVLLASRAVSPAAVARMAVCRARLHRLGGDPDRAGADIARALEAARQVDASWLIGRALLERQWLHQRQGRSEEAADADATVTALLAGSPWEGRARVERMNRLLVDGDMERAEAEGDAAIGWLRSRGHTRDLVHALSLQASLLRAQGRSAPHRHLVEEGLALARELGDPAVEVLVLKELGAARALAGDFRAAAETARWQAEVQGRLGQDADRGNTLHNLAAYLVHLGDWDEGIAALGQAAARLEAAGNLRQLADTRAQRAWAEARRPYENGSPDVDALVAELEDCAGRCEQLGIVRGLAATLVRLADVLWFHGRPKEGLPHAQRAIAISDEHGYAIAVSARAVAAACEGALGEHDPAAETLDALAEQFRAMGASGEAAVLLTYRLYLELRRGDLEAADDVADRVRGLAVDFTPTSLVGLALADHAAATEA